MMNANKVTRLTAEKVEELEECSRSMAETEPETTDRTWVGQRGGVSGLASKTRDDVGRS